ncbi:MAG: hypothetical protein Kow0074_26120 [Candidatus Zixiibacteriota bacterium]
MNARIVWLVAVSVSLLFSATNISAQEYYYDLDSIWYVSPSNSKIAVQYDSSYAQPQLAAFLGNHPCLDDQVTPSYLHRGFQIFTITSGCSYATASADVLSDSVVFRALPVYVVDVDNAEFKVTDLIDVQFDEDLSTDSCHNLLEAYGLHFVDSSKYRHNLWVCALDDTIMTSPLPYGNSLHELEQTEWACAHQYAAPELQSDPTDSYFAHQWNLKNAGQNGGTPDNDIDADSAWLVPLTDSSFKVAILDDGFTAHIDLPSARLESGYDFFYQDFDPSPYTDQNHGMACMGILAATMGDTGISGVSGSSKIIPIRIFNDVGVSTDTIRVADAIRYAATRARIISNSWGYPGVSPIVHVANAIRDVVNGAGAGLQGPQGTFGCVMLFAAGNYADDPGGPTSVIFPANMPEVIAVGAIDNQAYKWDYSCYGEPLDLVAPSGWDGDPYGNMSMASNLWTIDQMGLNGWNPLITGNYAEEADDVDYTAMMGGTSGACPQVAGIVALLMARGHDSINVYNPTPDILDILAGSAEDLGATGWDTQFGHGRANAFRAMLAIIRGDLDNNGVLDAADVNLMIRDLFFGGPPALFKGLSDVNCDGTRDAIDLNLFIVHVYHGGPPPDICYAHYDY